MERTKFKGGLMVLLFLWIGLGIEAQTRDYELAFYDAYVLGDMNEWKSTMNRLEIDVKAHDAEEDRFELIKAYYGYIGYCIGAGRAKEARQSLRRGEEYLDLLANEYPDRVEPYAFKSGFYGFEMGLAGYKALILGPKSVSSLKKAATIDSLNVYFLVEKGNQMFYMPSFIGGDKAVALSYYQKAVECMEQEATMNKKDWYYLNVLVVLAQSYEATGNTTKALSVYRKILLLEPDFRWVKEELLPAFLVRHQLTE